LEEPDELGAGVEPDDGVIGTVSDLSTSSMDIVNPKRREPKEPKPSGDVGRKKR